MTAFWFISPAMCLLIRFYLSRQNEIRRLLLEEASDASDREVLQAEGTTIQIHSEDLDQTDLQNLRFVYPL
jgi:hypothetical protein